MLAPLERQFRRRLALLFAVFAGFALILVGRLVYWQVLPRTVPESKAAVDEESTPFSRPQRGAIRDRYGVPLAVEIPEYEITAAPNWIRNPEGVAKQLAPYLNQSWETIYNKISDKNARYALLARGVPMEAGLAIEKLNIENIYAEAKPRRAYPLSSTASHVLGFVNTEGQAFYGIEQQYDQDLRGRPGIGGKRNVINPHQFMRPRNGSDVYLTLDRTIQFIAERELQTAVTEHRAEGGSVVVMDPKTGAVLAMASLPAYDPNNYAVTPFERFANPAVSAQYEPGSVVKVMTMAAGLEEGVISPDSTYEDVGSIRIANFTIWNWDRKAHSVTTMTEMMQHSLNVGAVHVAFLLGPERLYRYLEAFGFARLTGIDLAGEIAGSVRKPTVSNWSQIDLATNSFGQGMAATPLQVTTAIAAIANGGVLMRPYIVDRVVDPDGRIVKETQPQPQRRVVSEAVAREVGDMLVKVVSGGVHQAEVPGYRVAGKTGTSQIPVPGGYDPDWNITSFAGYGPADDPQFVILVKVDKPRAGLGSDVAAPAFKRIAEQLFTYMQIPPDNVRLARR